MRSNQDDPVPRAADVVCIGGGPAGLTAAYELSASGRDVIVLEKDSHYVGGISRTVEYKGYRFDIGGHRFFSKSREMEDLWTEILPQDMLTRTRLSRILYRGRFFDYPLRPLNVLRRLGPVTLCLCIASYLKARIRPYHNPDNFEQWVINRFGERLYRIFFKTYTEKVWGMPCIEIAPDWAAQRIKGLDLSTAIRGAFRTALSPGARVPRDAIVKTLVDSFRYPRHGPGMMWEKAAQIIRERGASVCLGCEVIRLDFNQGERQWSLTLRREDHREFTVHANHVVSSAPIREIVAALRPPPEPQVLAAAAALKYRDFLIVALIIDRPHVFDDNWIYIHDPGIDAMRIQNFKAWSADMVPDRNRTCLGVEYSCFKNDSLWHCSDAALIDHATSELAGIGLIDPETVIDGCIVRQEKAYPVYTHDYEQNVDTVRRAIRDRYPGLHLVGRNGMHKYNNQDHSMMTAVLTARNILGTGAQYDPWSVNVDAQYLETNSAQNDAARTGRQVPRRRWDGSPGE